MDNVKVGHLEPCSRAGPLTRVPGPLRAWSGTWLNGPCLVRGMHGVVPKQAGTSQIIYIFYFFWTKIGLTDKKTAHLFYFLFFSC